LVLENCERDSEAVQIVKQQRNYLDLFTTSAAVAVLLLIMVQGW
jgi:hypothetical protein